MRNKIVEFFLGDDVRVSSLAILSRLNLDIDVVNREALGHSDKV